MKTIRMIILTVASLLILIALYIFGVKPFDRFCREACYQCIIRPLVQDRSVLIPKSGTFSLGLYRPELPYQFTTLYAIQESLSVPFSIISYYQAWGDGSEHRFNPAVGRNLRKGGFVPMITWEPWIVAFNGYSAGDNPDSSLTIINSGVFDEYIKQYARSIVRFGKPVFIRPGHEMSNAWYPWSMQHGNSPESYRAFWRHVVTIFREQGARNAAFVWNPYTPGDTVCYPGNEWVDWVGLDIFNFGTLAENGGWMDFYTITKILYDAIRGYGKPVIIAEVGCADAGGNKTIWFRDMFHYLAVKNFPLVKALVLFDTPHATTPGGLPVDLGISSSGALTVIAKTDLSTLNINHHTKKE